MSINYSLKQSGFTLIELLVVAPLVILLIGVMIGYISAVTGDGLKSQQKNSLAYETQNALDDIDSTTARAITFKNKTQTLTAPQGPSDGTGAFESGNNILVLESIALTANSSNDNRFPVYSESGLNGSCNISSAPYTYYTVYFVPTGTTTLYKRIVLSNSPRCAAAVPQQKNSCSAAAMLLANKGSCQVEDEKLADNITSFDVTYLNDAGSLTSYSSATTVNIKINAQKNVAGSLLTYTGTFRSKKQNSFQGTVADNQVTGNNLVNPDQYNCNWDPIANASSFAVRYRFGPGTDTTTWEAWNTSTQPAGTNTIQFDVSTRRGQKLECEVTANVVGGTTVAYTKFALNPIPLWTDPTLENNWIRYDNYYAGAGFTKTASGMVVLKGLIRAGTAPGRAFQLPENYRPSGKLVFQQSAAAVSGPSAAGRVDIESDGSVYVQGSANAWVSLAGMNFVPTKSPSPFTTGTFANSWINYDSGLHANAGYMQDSAGRLRVQGLIKSGVSTDPTLAVNIPASLRPAEYEHVAAHNSGSFGVIGNVPSNGINVKGGSNGYVSINTLTYPSSYTGWTNLTLVNGWARYPGYTTPKFTKGTDGLVMLKGLLNNGAAGTYITNIPGNLKLCPKDRHVYAAGATGGYGRIDVEPGTATGGCGVSFQSGSTGWVSLDAISWVGEI